jgi:hypothetical protein
MAKAIITNSFYPRDKSRNKKTHLFRMDYTFDLAHGL